MRKATAMPGLGLAIWWRRRVRELSATLSGRSEAQYIWTRSRSTYGPGLATQAVADTQLGASQASRTRPSPAARHKRSVAKAFSVSAASTVAGPAVAVAGADFVETSFATVRLLHRGRRQVLALLLVVQWLGCAAQVPSDPDQPNQHHNPNAAKLSELAPRQARTRKRHIEPATVSKRHCSSQPGPRPRLSPDRAERCSESLWRQWTPGTRNVQTASGPFSLTHCC